MPRIAHLIETMDVQAGGTSTAFLNTFAAIREQPFCQPVHAFTRRPPTTDPSMQRVQAAPDAWSLADGLGRYVIPGDLGRLVARAAQSRSFDLLHIHGLWSPDLLAAAQACARAGIPYVWEPHGMLVREAYQQKRLKKELFMTFGMRTSLRNAAALVFVTAEERDHSMIPRGIGPDRLHVVRAGRRTPGHRLGRPPPRRGGS